MSNAKIAVAGVIALGLLGYGVYRMFPRGEGQVVLASGAVLAGEDIAAPLSGSVKTLQRGDVVYLVLQLADASGRPVRAVMLPGGKRPDPPRVEVFDDAGRRVYSCTLRYG